jgi:hypothetical protein
MAPPQAPVQAIRREAHATPADANPMRIDYGTELELPGDAPAGSPSTVSAGPVHDNVRAIPLPKPSAALKRPGGATAPAPAARAVETAEREPGTETRVREIVVPVKLAADARYEIVIKLQIDTTS